MKKLALALTCGFGLFAVAISAEDEPRIVSKPLGIGALQEFGQLERGIYKIGPGNVGEVWTNDWMDHFGAFLTKEAVVDERLFLSGGLGGVFEFRKPERVDPGFYGSQRKGFFIGPTKAVAEYHFGDPAKPYLTIGSGMFMYKYNQDAFDLGEYLYRSGAYPAYTSTGGYVVVNSAAANLQGFKSSLDLGSFKADLLLTTETNLAPLYDWSLGGVVSYSIADGLLDLGAGVNFKRLIQVKPSRTSKNVDDNGYFVKDGKTYSSNSNYYNRQVEFYTNKKTAAANLQAAAEARKAALEANHTAADSQLATIEGTKAASYAATAAVEAGKAAVIQVDADTVNAVIALDNSDPNKPKINHYTNAGILLMGRASLDLKKIFKSDLFGPQDLKLYSEIALLGVKNYPIFYEKRSDRMPIMVGFNLPGFKIFDLVAVQVEQYKSPWLNNTSQIAGDAIPLPAFPIGSDSIASVNEWNDLATKDDFKWSILIQKKLGNFITFSAQAANDHMRVVSSRYFYGPQFDHNEVTVSKSDWYWMTQLSWGI